VCFMKALVKKLLPPHFIRALQRNYYEHAQLKFTLTSGIQIEVLSHVDWCIYTDIFVDGEYDRPIETLVSLARSGRTELKILDLGCNVGFFLLRVLDRLGAEGLRPQLYVGAVEPDSWNIAEMKRRLGEQEVYRSGFCQLHLAKGLAGKRQGAAAFEQRHSYHAGRVVESSAGGRRNEVRLDYVDLIKVFGQQSWDLVKCDIEGSEGEFVAPYPELLERTATLVLEFHHGICYRAQIAEQLHASGFVYEGAIVERAANSVHWFVRRER
jgi:FkbM family methyltransferase